MLVTVFDPYLSISAPFQLVASVSEQLVMQQLLLPAGYPIEVAQDALCTFRLRNHIFTANDRCRPSDGDSFDIVFHGYGSMPQPDRVNEVEAPNLLQIRKQVWKLSSNDHRPLATEARSSPQETQTVELAQHINDDKKDINGVPFTLALASKEAKAHGMSIVFCVWELNDGNHDILTFPANSFRPCEAKGEFKSKFNLRGGTTKGR